MGGVGGLICFALLVTWALSECTRIWLVSVVACVFSWMKWNLSNFGPSVYVDVDAMRVYVVDTDDHVLSCLGGVFFLAFCGGPTGRVLVWCFLLVCFWR
jgi:hypothetical protein